MVEYRAGVAGMTIPAVVDRAASSGRGEALVFPDERISYAEFSERSRVIAKRLGALGVGPGDHVGYVMLNGVDIMTLMVGIMRLGAVAVPVNARYKGEEIAYVSYDRGWRISLMASDGTLWGCRLCRPSRSGR